MVASGNLFPSFQTSVSDQCRHASSEMRWSIGGLEQIWPGKGAQSKAAEDRGGSHKVLGHPSLYFMGTPNLLLEQLSMRPQTMLWVYPALAGSEVSRTFTLSVCRASGAEQVVMSPPNVQALHPASPFSFSPNMVRKTVKLMGPGASFTMASSSSFFTLIRPEEKQ